MCDAGEGPVSVRRLRVHVDDRRAAPRAGERLISGHDAPSWKCMPKDVVWIIAPHLDDEVPDAERRCCAPSTSPDGN